MKILIADDHALFRDGIRMILRKLAKDVTLIEANNLQDALKTIKSSPDILHLILLDLNMPGMNGAISIKKVREASPATPVIMLTEEESPVVARQAFEAGASGYITKSTKAKVMLNALRLVLDGGIYTPSSMIQPSADISKLLTLRQREVLARLAKGGTNKEIARSLKVSEGTIKQHVHNLYKKLNISNRHQAILAAQRLRIV